MSSMIETIFHEMYHYYQHITIPNFLEKYYREFEEHGYFGNKYEIEATKFAVREISRLHEYDVYKEFKPQIDVMLKYLPEIVKYVQSIGSILITASVTYSYLTESFRNLPHRARTMEDVLEYCYYTSNVLYYLKDFFEMYKNLDVELFTEARNVLADARKRVDTLCKEIREFLSTSTEPASELTVSMIYRELLDIIIDVIEVTYHVILALRRYALHLCEELKELVKYKFLEEFFA